MIDSTAPAQTKRSFNLARDNMWRRQAVRSMTWLRCDLALRCNDTFYLHIADNYDVPSRKNFFCTFVELDLTSVSEPLCSIDFSLQSIGECGYDIQPWLLYNYHLVVVDEFHVQHAVVPQAGGTGRALFGSVIAITTFLIGYGLRSFPLHSSDVSFGKETTLQWELFRCVYHHNSTKRTLR